MESTPWRIHAVDKMWIKQAERGLFFAAAV